MGVFPAALKRPIAKWYLTPGKGSDLFTQEDKEDTAFVRGVPGTCTNENLVDFFNAGPLVKSQYNKKLIELPYPLFKDGANSVDVSKDNLTFFIPEFHSRSALKSTSQVVALQTALRDRSKYKLDNWDKKVDMFKNHSATTLGQQLCSEASVKHEATLDLLTAELALCSLANAKGWQQASIAHLRDVGRKAVLEHTITGNAQACRQQLLNSSYNSGKLFGPISRVLASQISTDTSGASKLILAKHKSPANFKRKIAKQGGSQPKAAKNTFFLQQQARPQTPRGGSSRGRGRGQAYQPKQQGPKYPKKGRGRGK